MRQKLTDRQADIQRYRDTDRDTVTQTDRTSERERETGNLRD